MADLGFVIVLRVKQALAINPEPAVTAKRTALNAHIHHLPMFFEKRPAISNMAERREVADRGRCLTDEATAAQAE